jgi:hypothetical protein
MVLLITAQVQDSRTGGTKLLVVVVVLRYFSNEVAYVRVVHHKYLFNTTHEYPRPNLDPKAVKHGDEGQSAHGSPHDERRGLA